MPTYSERIKETRILVYSVDAPTEEKAKQALEHLRNFYVLEDLKLNWDNINSTDGELLILEAKIVEMPEEEDGDFSHEYLGQDNT